MQRIRQQAIALSLAALLLANSAQAQELPLETNASNANTPANTPANANANANPNANANVSTSSDAAAVDVMGMTSLALRQSALREAMGASTNSVPGMLTGTTPKEIRLSSGAKTAIIITAIIVGGLIIIGVIVVGKPHKHL